MSALLDSLAAGFEGDATRRALLDEVLRDGLPARAEAWKYTSLRQLERRSFAPARATAIDAALLAAIPAPRIVFVNGQFDAASSELSLDHVFRDSPRKSGAVRQTGGFSFDQFFSDKAVANPPAPDTPAEKGTTPESGTAQSDDDVGQFTSWLQGLKKK